MRRIAVWVAASVAIVVLVFIYQFTQVASEEKGGDSARAATGVGGKEAYATYLDCLRQQGIPLPAGTPTSAPQASDAPKPTGPAFPFAPTKPASVTEAAWANAKAACAHLIPIAAASAK
jgi:hypothetical protein